MTDLSTRLVDVIKQDILVSSKSLEVIVQTSYYRFNFIKVFQSYNFSQELDLHNPSSFRDLSRPMGAQTPDRLKQFQKRYTDWDDPQGKFQFPVYHVKKADVPTVGLYIFH